MKIGVLVSFLAVGAALQVAAALSGENLVASPGNMTYLVDPAKGDDGNPAGKPWKTYGKLNSVKLAPGDQVIVSPGIQTETLMLSASGTRVKPVTIRFLPGVHTITSNNVQRLQMFVSNSVDGTDPKPVGILLRDCRHLRLEGGGVEGEGKTTILYDGRMVQIFNDHSEDITFTGLVFDLKRPTVSEFRVLEAGTSNAVIQVAEGSDYAIEKGKFFWKGDWGPSAIGQTLSLADGRCRRTKHPRGWNAEGQGDASAKDLGGRKVRLDYPDGETGLKAGHQYHFRNGKRDRVGVHNARCRDIVFRDCDFYALSGMGFVSQFTENIIYQRVNVAPPRDSIRTCAAWADIFQFSNCKGDILVDSCRLSGMQDDALNCHGTYLQAVRKEGERLLLVRYVHPQTYGFAPYTAGDEIAVISRVNMCEYPGNPRGTVSKVERVTDKDWLITLNGPVPSFKENDVIDNVTWNPNITARNNHISVDPVRGFLLGTRGKIIIESNTFERCRMPGILVEGDAAKWFESSPIRDMEIRGNRFIDCGIEISSTVREPRPDEPVHENIRIIDNYFEGAGVTARSVRGLTIKGNRSPGGSLPVRLEPSCTGTNIFTAEASEDKTLLTVARIVDKDEFKSEAWGPAKWYKDGSGYTTLEKPEAAGFAKDPKDGKDIKDVVCYDPVSGRREVLVYASNLVARGESGPLKIEDYSFSDDNRKLLILTNAKRVWRSETRGDYWVFDISTGKLGKLGGKADPSTLMFASFSPDGRSVAYVCRNDLYVQSLDNMRITQLTEDGSASIVNGTSDWVYEEEFDLRNAFRWSPDGKSIAYWQFDTSGVREFKLVNNTDELYPKITSYPYPKVGETNSACRIGIVSVKGGRTRWFKPGTDSRNHYIPQMEWAPDSSHVIFQQLNRLQNTNQVMLGEAKSGKIKELLVDRDDAWVEVVDKMRWIQNGQRFLFLSERDGWQHIYAVSYTNRQAVLLTPGAYDAIKIEGVDEKHGWVYFIASPDNPTRRYLYRASLNASGEVVRVTPEDQPGTHSYHMSKDCLWALRTFSSSGQPPVVDLVSLPDHKTIRVLADNSKLRAKLAELNLCPKEFFRVGLTDGVQLDAWCIKPPQFDPAKKYPLLVHVYGEPADATVADAWDKRDYYLWHCMLAQQGYVVVSIDNRGTPVPRGRDWRKSIYRQIGILASADQAEATRQILRERPYLDPARVGIWGWSGGGSMSLNAIFRYPDLYRTAIAIAFVSNQRFYDTIYQERYMGLPSCNADGYKNGSPITFAHQLKGNLLLVYGTGDDNCHYQNCEVLINELVKQNKQFSLMSYPNRSHSIKEGDNTRRHLFETFTRYLHDNLPADK